ncbi:hypothetical protein F4802DRAFT_571708 [Xylaria palmicola]|nr:hypothetical protein F4802DRAFT_571708 [Xylaria palmicola]
MAGIQEGLYFISADSGLTGLLEPQNTAVAINASTDVTILLLNLNQPDSSVWRLEVVPQKRSRTRYFSITAGDSTALAINDTTSGIFLDKPDTSDDRQLWYIKVRGYVPGVRVVIKNKFNDMALDIGPSNSVIGTANPLSTWTIISLADSVGDDGGDDDDDDDDDMDDMIENRDWLRDMLWYFTRRYGRASTSVGFYPFLDGHINYPNTWLLGQRFVGN